MVKPDTTKPTKDTPVDPAEAHGYVQQVTQAIGAKVASQVPDYADGAVRLEGTVPMNLSDRKRIASNFVTPSKEPGQETKTTIVVSGPNTLAGQRKEPTTATLKQGDKSTVFAFGRDEDGRIAAKEVLSPAEVAAGVQPRDLKQFMADQAKVPAAHYTKEAQAKIVRDKGLGMEKAIDEHNRVRDAQLAHAQRVRVEGGLPKGIVDKGMVEDPSAADKRVAAAKAAEAEAPDVTGIKGAKAAGSGGWRVGKNFAASRRPGTAPGS